jgi:hypothetical protein
MLLALLVALALFLRYFVMSEAAIFSSKPPITPPAARRQGDDALRRFDWLAGPRRLAR